MSTLSVELLLRLEPVSDPLALAVELLDSSALCVLVLLRLVNVSDSLTLPDREVVMVIVLPVAV